MSIFNTPQDVQKVKKASAEYAKMLDKTIEAKKKYCQVLNDIVKDREKQNTELKDENAKKIFLKEYNEISNFKTPILTKENQLMTIK
jgi:hypothetical protein